MHSHEMQEPAFDANPEPTIPSQRNPVQETAGETKVKTTVRSPRKVHFFTGVMIVIVLVAVIGGLAAYHGTKSDGYRDTVVSADVVRHIGCHKIETDIPFARIGFNSTFVDHIAHARARTVEWLREQQNRTTGLWIDEHTTALVLTSLQILGYVNDGGTCSGTTLEATSALNSRMKNSPARIAGMPGGKLAEFVIGLRAVCIDPRHYHGRNLIESLVDKLDRFPQSEFDNLYQYSKAVIALYASREKISEKFLERILSKLLSSKENKHQRNGGMFTDTQAIALVAMETVIREISTPDWIWDARRELTNGSKRILNYLTQRGFTRHGHVVTEIADNLVTMTENMMAYIAHEGIAKKDRVPLKNVLVYILSQQNNSGSFRDLGTTLSVVSLLAGRSLLFVRDIDCGKQKDIVDSVAIKKFINERKKIMRAYQFSNTSRNENNRDVHTSNNETLFVFVRIQLIFSERASIGLTAPKPIDISVPPGSNAMDALRKAGEINRCYNPTTVQTKWGPSIQSICNVVSNTNTKTYWAFEVNNKMASVGAGSYIVKNRDNLTFALKNYR